MIIKNTAALLLILVMNTTRMHAMEGPCSPTEKSLLDMEEKYRAFKQTPQYQNYEKAKILHEKHKTEETRLLMEDAAGQLLETKEGQCFIQAAEQKQPEIKAVAIVSDNMIIKNRAMINTQAYIQYEEAKANHERYNTPDTLYIFNMCKIDLLNTKEYQEFAHSTQQEMRVVKNIAKPHHWLHAQETQSLDGLHKQKMAELKFAQKVAENKNAAWLAVTKTTEYQLFKQAKIDNEGDKTLSASREFKRYQHAAKATNEYFNFCKANEEKRQLYAKVKGYTQPITVIEFGYDKCLFDYLYNEKMIKKLNIGI